MTAEQAKAESTQRGLEEERRALSMQINIEREELERAKVKLMNIHMSVLAEDKCSTLLSVSQLHQSALLEEQKTVMQHCAEERRKLAAD